MFGALADTHAFLGHAYARPRVRPTSRRTTFGVRASRRASNSRAICETTSKRPSAAAKESALASACSSSSGVPGAPVATVVGRSPVLVTLRDESSESTGKQGGSESMTSPASASQLRATVDNASTSAALLTAGSLVRVQQSEPNQLESGRNSRITVEGGRQPRVRPHHHPRDGLRAPEFGRPTGLSRGGGVIAE
jgi:hypothetical protein